MSVFGGVAKQKQKVKSNGHNGHFGIGDCGLYFRVDGGDREKLAYAFVLDLDTIRTDFAVNKAFVELSGKWGTFQVGNRKGPLASMFEDGVYVFGIGHGIDGGMWSLLTDSAGTIDYKLEGVGKVATKAIYYTPIVRGVQVAVSYTPNTSHCGDLSRNNRIIQKNGDFETAFDSGIYPKFAKRAQPYGLNNVSVLVKYKQEFGDWKVCTAAGFVTEHTVLINPFTGFRIPVRNARSFGASFSLGYKDVSLGLGYGNNGKSRLPKTNALSTYNTGTTDAPVIKTYLGKTHLGNAGSYFNSALSYNPGEYQLSIGYARTTRRNNIKSHVGDEAYTTYAAYRPLKGLEFFAEGAFLRGRTNAQAMAVQQSAFDSKGDGDKACGNNVGYAVMVGTAISF
jgi:hypothetical protein